MAVNANASQVVAASQVHAGDHVNPRDIRIIQHSNLIYWWPVWLYGYICALLTYFESIGVAELASEPGKVVLFHPSSWVGLSFMGVILFVIVFSNVKARGIYSLVVIMLLLGGIWLASHVPGMDQALGWLSLLR